MYKVVFLHRVSIPNSYRERGIWCLKRLQIYFTNISPLFPGLLVISLYLTLPLLSIFFLFLSFYLNLSSLLFSGVSPRFISTAVYISLEQSTPRGSQVFLFPQLNLIIKKFILIGHNYYKRYHIWISIRKPEDSSAFLSRLV